MSTKTLSPAPFTVGTRVRWSGYALKSDRDYWLSCDSSSAKSAAKDHLDRKTAERGTVESCEPGKYSAWVVDVRTDSGHLHQSLPYLWEAVAPAAGGSA